VPIAIRQSALLDRACGTARVSSVSRITKI
jgi:hypothetical protein